MDLGLKDTRAWVTAASKGLGRACAAALAAEGARVFIVSRSEERLAATAAEIGAAGYLAADLAQPGAPERAVEAATAALGGLDILVCNAGGPPPGTFESTPGEGWGGGDHPPPLGAVRLPQAAPPPLGGPGRGR